MAASTPFKALVVACVLAAMVWAADPERDFSGNWVLDTASSKVPPGGQPDAAVTISQSAAGILYSAGKTQWSYPLDGSESRKRVGGESRSSIAKWEGRALLINTLVSAAQDYTIMERWGLSRDRNTLTIARQVIRRTLASEETLVYRREGAELTAAAAPPAREPAPAPVFRPGERSNEPTLVKRPEPGVDPDITVPNGTRVLLALVNEVNTKRAKEGDRVYLRTDAPVAINGRVVIPRGSDVAGTITRAKPAGKLKGKGELFIRFDSLVLPNGVSRDFQARPSGGEGQVDGEGKPADGRTVLEGTGMGVGIGAMVHGLPGAAAGGAIGALAGVLLSRDQNVVLRPGAHVEMVLDRDLVFRPRELAAIR